MESRMPETLEDLLMQRPPTADKPLLGVMILVVEDSRFACDAVRLICQRSGARIRRAESLASATKHLCAYRPRVAIVDLGLPDGSGLSLISQLSRADPRIEGLIATSGDETQAEAAMDAGADIFLPKPLTSISAFQNTLLGLLPAETRPKRVAIPVEDHVKPDPVAMKDDLSLAVDLLTTDPDARTLDYLAAFLKSLASAAGDKMLAELGDSVASLRNGQAGFTTPRRIATEIQNRIGALMEV
jgi:DNA-binding response OmpR family regulator